MAAKPAEAVEKKTWTTWDELLLACAVKRHGLKEWDAVATELQNRTSLPVVLTAQICRNKYHDLKRRFLDDGGDGEDNRNGDEVDSMPWLEELRKLRVAELKQEVHRHDLSIQSLQLKVKRLEEERERSLEANENDDGKPDLEKDTKEERSENVKNDSNGSPAEASPGNVAGKSISGDESNRSFNESNSTENRATGQKADVREPAETGAGKPDPDSKPVGEDSCNGSSDTVAKHAASKPSQKKKVGDDSTELRGLAAEPKEEMKESSDVQSSASLTKKIRRRGEVFGGVSGSDEPVVSPATIKRDSVKSEPFVGFLDIIRLHKHGSIFERRLESQKTDKYNNIIRQHVDLRTVQTKIDDGSYSSCTTKFYLDLLLLFTNAIVFFPKASAESAAAHELRHLVLKELKKKKKKKQPVPPPPHPEPPPLLQPKTDPERSDPLIAKQKSSAPIVVCRKRSSILAKPSSSNKQADEKLPVVVHPKPPVKSSPAAASEVEKTVKSKGKEMEKPVTGARSMRRSGNTSTRGNSTALDKNPSPVIKGDAAKTEKKKPDATPAATKKSGAADFLKRIKKNSPAKGPPPPPPETNTSRRDPQKRKMDERKDVPAPARQKGGGKQAKEESSPSKRGVGRPSKRGGKEVAPAKRGRDGGESEVGSKRPKKRSKR